MPIFMSYKYPIKNSSRSDKKLTPALDLEDKSEAQWKSCPMQMSFLMSGVCWSAPSVFLALHG